MFPEDRFHPLGPDADRLHDDLLEATELEATPRTSRELGSTLVLHQFLPAWDVQAYLRVAGIRLHVHNSRYPFYEATGELPQLSDGNFLLPKEQIIMHLQTFHTDIDEFLTDAQRSESFAYRSMISEKLQRVMLYCRWVDSATYREVTRPHMKRQLPFPLNFFLPKKMHMDTMEELRVYGITSKEQAYVLARDCYTALNAKLESAGDQHFFFGDKPSALDVAVFGHIVDALGNEQLSPTVHQHAPLLVTLAERIRDAYFGAPGEQPTSLSEAAYTENAPNYFTSSALDSAFMKKVAPPLKLAFLQPYRSLDWSRRELAKDVALKKREQEAARHAAAEEEAGDDMFKKGPRNAILGALTALLVYAVAAFPVEVDFDDDFYEEEDEEDEYYDDED